MRIISLRRLVLLEDLGFGFVSNDFYRLEVFGTYRFVGAAVPEEVLRVALAVVATWVFTPVVCGVFGVFKSVRWSDSPYDDGLKSSV